MAIFLLFIFLENNGDSIFKVLFRECKDWSTTL